MLKIVPPACLTLAVCLALSPSLTLPAVAQTGDQTVLNAAAPLLSPSAFTVLDTEAKSLYLQGVIARWQTSANGLDFAFVQAAVANVVTPAGDLRTSPAQAQPFGRAILLSYRVSRDPSLYRAAKQLREVLQLQQDKADTSAAPFLADFGVTFGDVSAAEQAAAILLRVDTSSRDLETGLLRDADLSRNTFYALDLLETINRLPIGFHHRRGLSEALNKTVSALIARQGNHAVWQTPDQPAQTLLLNAFVVARAVRLGELAESDAALARQMADLAHSKPLGPLDAGAEMLARSEAEQVGTQSFGQGTTVVADAWFDPEPRQNAAGKLEASPSKWTDDADQGLSFFGFAFQRYGLQLDMLRSAPTAASLSSAQIFVLPFGNGSPAHQISKQDADAIEGWVKEGGVLVLLQTGGPATDPTTVNLLSDRFGMRFQTANEKTRQLQQEQQDTVTIPSGTSVFGKPHRLLSGPISTMTLSAPAHPVVTSGNTVAMAVASVGGGTVLAVADTWLWNQYVDGRKASGQSDNFDAAVELAGWLLRQTQQ